MRSRCGEREESGQEEGPARIVHRGTLSRPVCAILRSSEQRETRVAATTCSPGETPRGGRERERTARSGMNGPLTRAGIYSVRSARVQNKQTALPKRERDWASGGAVEEEERGVPSTGAA